MTLPLAVRFVQDVEDFITKREHDILLATVPREPGRVRHGAAIVQMREAHPNNRGIFHPMFPDALGVDRGWSQRYDLLEGQRSAMSKAIVAGGGQPLPCCPVEPSLREGTESLTQPFAERLAMFRCLLGQPWHQDELLVLLAPDIVEHESAWAADLARLFADERLSHVRWILVDTGHQAIAKMVRTCGRRSLVTHYGGKLAALDEASFIAFEVSRTTSPFPADLADWLGPESPIFGDDGAVIHNRMATAFARFEQGQDRLAFQIAGRAIEMCAARRWIKEELTLRLAQLKYQLAYDDAAAVRHRAEVVLRRAREGRFPVLAAVAWAMLGALDVLEQRWSHAAEEYMRGASMALAEKREILAVESFRGAGQAAINARDLPLALEAWRGGIRGARPRGRAIGARPSVVHAGADPGGVPRRCHDEQRVREVRARAPRPCACGAPVATRGIAHAFGGFAAGYREHLFA